MKKSYFEFIAFLLFLMIVINPVLAKDKENSSYYSIAQDTTSPVITIINPDQTTVGDTVTIVFEAVDENNITEYELYIDDELRGNDSLFVWDTDMDTEGLHTIKARAKDEANNWGESSLTVTVDRAYKTGVFKIMEYNVYFSGIEEPYVNTWLEVAKEENADIIVADETGDWHKDNNFLFNQVLDELNSYFVNEDPYTGYAVTTIDYPNGGSSILSRFPIIEAKEITTGVLDNNQEIVLYRTVIDVTVEIGETYVHILGCHLKCCAGYDYLREIDIEAVMNYLDTLGPVPIIFAGDFNSYSPFDTGELAANVANLGSTTIAILLNQSNPKASKVHRWVDVFRELNPYDKGYTYIDDWYQSRIDFIFVNEFFFDKLINSTTGDTPSVEIGSDHRSLDLSINMDASTSDLRPPIKVTGLNGSNLTWSNNEVTEFNLSWVPNIESDLSHYVVFQEDTAISQVLTTNYVVSELAPKTVHNFTVAAADNNGNIGFKSIPLKLNTSYGICSRPSAPILKATPGSRIVNLTWELPSDGGLAISEFVIYRLLYGTIDGDVQRIVARTSPDQMYYTFTGLVNEYEYEYVVSAVNDLGESNFSNILKVTPSISYATTTTGTSETGATPLEIGSVILGLTISVVIIPMLRAYSRKFKK